MSETGPNDQPSGESLYERYRDALRGGHLAALRGAHDAAVRAYLEAAALLPDRAAPYVALGKTQLAAGRAAEALDAYESAVQRVPNDSAALDGQARALIALDRPFEAADVLDRLASTFLEQDRQADALATIERATEIAESRWRRKALERLRGDQTGDAAPWLSELPRGDGPTAAPEAPEPAPAPGPISDDLRRLAEQVEAASVADDVPGLLAGARALARADRLRAAIDACHDALSVAPADPAVHRTLAAIYRRRGWERAARLKLAIVERYQRVADDPHELDRLAETAEATGDLDGLLRVVDRHARQGRTATALDLAFGAMATTPDDARVHLAIARLHLSLGWRRRTVDEVARLARLLELTGDQAGRDAVADFVNGALRPEVGA
jgi:tetratricopeptide (TPR) repeat protein